MANIMDEFPSKYLKAEDVEETHPTVTIKYITREEVGKERDKKPVIYFNEFDKGVVLNKTNATNISKLYGSDTDNWPGRTVVLGTAMVDFNGESKPAIRIWPPKRQSANAPLTQQRQSNPSDDGAGQRPFAPAGDLDDDIPFAPEWR